MHWPRTDIGESSEPREFASFSPLLPKIAEDNDSPHIKMLLLGPSNSGKSTLTKQMRIILAENSITEHDRKVARQIMFSNLKTAFRKIEEAMNNKGLDYDHPQSHGIQLFIQSLGDIGIDDSFPTDCRGPIERLWDDESVQEELRSSCNFALYQNLKYYLGNAHRIFSADYIPTNEDILHTYVQTLGVTTISLKSDRASYSVVDPGGAEYRKWDRVFKDIDCVIFMVPLCAYDTVMSEHSPPNQISEALLMFNYILALREFDNKPIILVMNKIDLFKQKLKKMPIVENWPDFQGSNDDYQTAIHFFTHKFLTLPNTKDRKLHVRCTNATDTESVKRTLHGIEDLLLSHIAGTKNAALSGSRSEAQAQTFVRNRVRQYLGLDVPRMIHRFPPKRATEVGDMAGSGK